LAGGELERESSGASAGTGICTNVIVENCVS
jgi:hypothetical protein